MPVIQPSIRDVQKQSSVSQDWVTSKLANQDVPLLVSRHRDDKHSGPLYSSTNSTAVPLKTKKNVAPTFVTPSDRNVIKPSSVSQDWVTSRLSARDVPQLVSRHRDNDLASLYSTNTTVSVSKNKKERASAVSTRPSSRNVLQSSSASQDWVSSRLSARDVPQLVSRHRDNDLFPFDSKSKEKSKQDDEALIFLTPSNKDVIDKSSVGDEWVTSRLGTKDVPLVVSRHMAEQQHVPAVVKDGALEFAATNAHDDELMVLTPSKKDVLDKSSMGDDWVTSQLDAKDVPLVVSRHMGKGDVPAVVKDGALGFAATEDTTRGSSTSCEDSKLSNDDAAKSVQAPNDES